MAIGSDWTASGLGTWTVASKVKRGKSLASEFYTARSGTDNRRPPDASVAWGMSSTPVVPGTSLGGGQVSAVVEGGVCTVRFSHPKGNSLPGALLVRLAETIASAGRNPEARLIVLRSEGDGPFCAGASFDELAAIREVEAGEEFFSGFARVILAMVRAPKLVVVRVHGRTAGGGVGIAAASSKIRAYSPCRSHHSASRHAVSTAMCA